jgi:hypothetical protein
MKRMIVAVRDRAADTFGTPFYVVAVGQAIRSFADEVNREAADSSLYMHPEDFDLYELGTFDDDDGSFDTHAPKMIAVGKDLKVPKG